MNRSGMWLGPFLVACTGGGTDAPPHPICDYAAHAEAFDWMDPCAPEDKQPYVADGIWEITGACGYVDTSDSFSSMLGASCSGRVAICGDWSSGHVSWQELGPNGEGLGEPADMTIRTDQGEGGGFQFAVYGTSSNTSPGLNCTARIEHYLLCARGQFADLGDYEAFCTKVSYNPTEQCGIPEGYGRYETYYTRVADCPN